MEVNIINDNNEVITEDVINALKNVFDPEIDYSVYDIGLIYGVNIQKELVSILMTLTTINCPEAQTLPMMVKEAVEKVCPNLTVDVELTFEPEWNVDNMSDEIKLKLGLL
jgi:metal-sulfur cluster biosynthetic enzyme